MFTDINSEDRLVQQTFAEHLEGSAGTASTPLTPRRSGRTAPGARVASGMRSWCGTCARRWSG